MVSTPDLPALFDDMLRAQALEHEFQPIADLAHASVLGYEALMRGPAGSPLRSPEELLRVARSVGRIAELERKACLGAIGAFARLGLPGKLFLNLSAPLIGHFALDRGRELLECARHAGVSPRRLVLELTEHERVEDVDGLQAAMAVLSAPGIQFAIDDFGDGRSSLRLWVQLRPQIVKLDKYFVHGLQRDSRKLEVVRTVLRLADVLGTPLVAEGIEDPAELAALRDLGCDYAQGYYIGRPAASPPSELPAPVADLLNSAKIPMLPMLRRVRPSVDRLRVSAPAVGPHLAGGELRREDGCYAGVATGESLVGAVTELRVEAARHAHPLTLRGARA